MSDKQERYSILNNGRPRAQSRFVEDHWPDFSKQSLGHFSLLKTLKVMDLSFSKVLEYLCHEEWRIGLEP